MKFFSRRNDPAEEASTTRRSGPRHRRHGMSASLKKSLPKKLIASCAAIALAAPAVVLATMAPASAETVAGVIPSSISVSRTGGEPNTPLRVNQKVDIAASWAVADSARGGDTFTLTMPREFNGHEIRPFLLVDHVNGGSAGTCVVSGTPSTITCTLNESINDRMNVGGSLWATAWVNSGTDDDTVKFLVNGDEWPVDLPGTGGIEVPGAGPPGMAPGHLSKGAYDTIALKGTISWVIGVPPSVNTGGTVHVVDRIQPGSAHHHVENTGGAYAICDGGENEWVDDSLFVWTVVDANTLTVDIDPAAFTPQGKNCGFQLYYQTAPVGEAAVGDVYNNRVEVDPLVANGSMAIIENGGGTGSGEVTEGAAQVTKKVTGPAAGAVQTNRQYPFTYEVKLPGEEYGPTRDGVVAVDGATNVGPFPHGTEITLRESPLSADAQVVWEAPSYSVNNGPAQTGEVTFTIGADTTVEIEIENTASHPPANPGAVELMKISTDGHPLGGAEFAVSSADNEVVAVGTTDANGRLTFGNLTAGQYTVTETAAPAGFEISAAAQAGYSVTVEEGKTSAVTGSGPFGEIVNSRLTPTLGTTATNKATGGKLLPGEGGTISDRVVYANLIPGTTYTVNGELRDKDTGDTTGITASTTFVAHTANGSVTLDFTVGAGYADKALVAFERLYAQGDNQNAVATHEDITSTEQTVTVGSPASLGTTATNKADGSKTMYYSGGIVRDTVTYAGLAPGNAYLLRGELRDTSTGLLIPGSSAETAFAATAADGSIMLDLTLPTGYAGKNVVAYEYLYLSGGTTLVAQHTELGDAGQTVTVGTPALGTTATNKEDGSHTLTYEGGTIVDEVRYTGLVPGIQYTLRGELIDKTTGQTTGITSEDLQFTPTARDGRVSVEFRVPGSFAGKTLVAFERLYQGSTLDARHTDINSTEQTVTVDPMPSVATTATNKATGDKTPVRFFGGVVVDEIRYAGLIPGSSYTVEGELMKKELNENTGVPTAIPTGITARTTFTPATAEGSVSLEFAVSDEYADTMLVAFEKLFDAAGALVADHEDIESTEQTITVGAVPAVNTVATNQADGSKILEFQGGTITDRVSYTNLIPGVEHVLEGELMDTATGESTGITASKTFTPETADGVIDIDFEVPMGFAGRSLVAFETVLENGLVIATHRDITYEPQTVKVRSTPTVSTSAADKADGDKTLAEHGGIIVDTVYFTGLIPGREYTLRGELMYKENGTTTGLTATRTFVPETADGSVDLEIVVPDGFKNTWVVVFETALDGDLIVAEHRDIDSEAQSIWVDETPAALGVDVSGLLAATGSSIPGAIAWISAGLIAVGAAVFGAGHLRKRRKGREQS